MVKLRHSFFSKSNTRILVVDSLRGFASSLISTLGSCFGTSVHFITRSVPSDLTEGINESKGGYTSEKQVESATRVYSTLVENRLNELKITLEALENAQKETTNA